jgi:hypothetical protein
MGIIETIQRAATLVFVVPVVLLGLEFLLDGQLVGGGAFLAIAALMIAVEEYVTRPSDLPTMALERVTDAVVKTDDDYRE